MGNNFKEWPADWPLYKQGCFGSYKNACDMLVGPCSCGAWHAAGEFQLREGTLYRYGQPVKSLERK